MTQKQKRIRKLCSALISSRGVRVRFPKYWTDDLKLAWLEGKYEKQTTMQVERTRFEHLLTLEAAVLELLRVADTNGSFMDVAESMVFLKKVVKGE